MVCSYVTEYSSVFICVYSRKHLTKTKSANQTVHTQCFCFISSVSFPILGEGLPSHLKTVRGKLARRPDFAVRCVIVYRVESRSDLDPQNFGRARSKIMLLFSVFAYMS